MNLPAGITSADVAYTIESFVHGPAPERFFAECRVLIRPGGLLVIVDDFRRPDGGAEAARAVDRFCRGWHVNTLPGRDELRAMARRAGFEHESTADLTPILEIGRLRDRAIDLLAAVLETLRTGEERFGHLVGGSALQQCLARGWIGYDFAVFRRGGDAPTYLRRNVATTGLWSDTSPRPSVEVSITSTDSSVRPISGA